MYWPDQFGKPTNETSTNEKKSQLPHQSQLAKITVPKLSPACHVPGFTWLTRPPAPNHMRSVTSKTKKQNLSSEKYFLSHTRCSFRKQYLDLGVPIPCQDPSVRRTSSQPPPKISFDRLFFSDEIWESTLKTIRGLPNKGAHRLWKCSNLEIRQKKYICIIFFATPRTCARPRSNRRQNFVV